MDSLGFSIISVILFLAITVLLSVSICLLRRHLNRRHLSTTSSTCRVAPENPMASSSSLIDLSRRSTSSAGGGGGDCAICLSKLEPREQLRSLQLCCHSFHADCVNKWLESNSTCPICRSPISASDSDVLRAIHASSGASGNSRLSSRRLSFRSSGRFFTGSSRRTEYDIEANLHAGEEISELFRWISGL